ncbi:hypothetical protein IscW_ISCW009606 [Ixodes scapularis]|uniref:EB domain-containing protein n=1 Tax=Ixodes scapularis TaxID=6945 RepID=B7Q212_IXOSC|nr:hypothetical protein IscW_ISCW009606 [Ixodes scapularis]|eukprot:XP_002410333.1 hypothetical protein IscW_ISCW009606 [Ixodes scapularis]
MYRCYDSDKTFKLDVKASSRDYVFRTHDAVAIDYKISTFADTQQCERDADCSPKHGPLSTCRDGHCSCLVGHVMTDDVCGPVSCLTDVECSDAGTRCVGGECACSGDFDLVGHRCRKSEELLISVKLVICCLGLVAGIAVFTAVSLTFLKNKAGFYLASSIETHKADDDDEDTIVTTATAEDDAVTLQLDRSQGQSQAEGQDEGLPTIFFRALFPTLSGGLFGEPADPNRISFGNTEVSGSTIDI